MNTITPTASPQKRIKKFPQPKLLTYNDYLRLTPADSANYELQNGKIVYMPSPIFKHQETQNLLSTYLTLHVLQHKLGKVVTAPMDTKFNENNVFQPDILFVQQNRLSINNKIIEGAPDLVVEILSPANDAKEMSYKKYIYETSGVKEYWIINIEQQTLIQYLLVDNELHRQKQLTITDTLHAAIIPNFSIALQAIFAE